MSFTEDHFDPGMVTPDPPRGWCWRLWNNLVSEAVTLFTVLGDELDDDPWEYDA